MTQTIDKYYQNAALSLSDSVSKELKVEFRIKRVEKAEMVYQALEDQLPKACAIGLLKQRVRGALWVLDSAIVKTLSHRMLGAKQDDGGSQRENFTESELFFSTWMMQQFVDHFSNNGGALSFARSEPSLEKVSCFFPDEVVWVMQLHCYLNNEPLGMIWGVHAKEEGGAQ